ncbi:MAG: lipoyl(octanoyl) transferase [Spirochaetia bacterium]|nr:lipoyl(octanoyl) transferase [Spirochaetia bacterium]
MKIFRFSHLLSYNQYISFQEKARQKRLESIFFLEHPPTITAGTSFQEKNLLYSTDELNQKGVELYYTKRGGDFTAHEPGQLVIYPHIDLKKRNISVMDFVGFFRLSIGESLLEIWDLSVIDKKESPGLYLAKEPDKKIVSFGIFFKSFFTSFGASINIENSLETFQTINPCGGKYENMVSIQKLGLDTKKKEELFFILRKKFKHRF